MTERDGGPAFPTSYNMSTRERGGSEPSNPPWGLTVRDWFAGQAITGWLAQFPEAHDSGNQTYVAEYAYKIADAMLAERSKP